MSKMSRGPVASLSRFSPPGSRGAFPRALASERAIAIDGEIGAWGVTAAYVRETLASLPESKELRITINSVGGSVTEGMAIYHALRNAKGRKIATVEGIAASMGSVILQAADVRRVASGSYVMIHNPSGYAEGESSDLEKTAEFLRKIESDMLDIYEARSGMERSKIQEMMNAETYMTAEEAVEYGFADEIAEDAQARFDLKAVAKLNQDKIPASVKAALSTQGNTMDEEEMKAKIAALEEENARLKAKAEKKEGDEPEHNAEEDEEEPEAEDEDEGEDKKEKAKAVLAAVRRVTGKRSLAEMEGALMALGSAHKLSTIGARKAEVAELVASGKLAPADRKWAESCDDKAFAAYRSVVAKQKIVPMGEKHKEPETGSAPEELTPAEKLVMKASGLSKETILKARTAKYTTKEEA